jgi:AcrR family transcriptional regulator
MCPVPPQPVARAKLLDAFTRLLLEKGERSATLDAVAAAAGVSKGGLLYHFKSREALVVGLADRLRELGAADAELMRAAPEGAAAYYIRTSNYVDCEFDRVVIAMSRLGPDAGAVVREVMGEVQAGWLAALKAQLGDVPEARAVMLMGDGLYYNAALAGAAVTVDEAEVAELLAVVERLVVAARHRAVVRPATPGGPARSADGAR